jgi:predicted secreted protein
MSVMFGIALYFLIWWTLLFAVLPLARAKTQGEAGEIVPGTPASAPSQLMIGRVVLINSALSAVVFAVVALAMKIYIVPIGDVYPVR